MEAEIYGLTKRDQRNWHVCDGSSPPSPPGTEDLRPAGEQSSYYHKGISLRRMKTTCLKWQTTKTEKVWKTDTVMELLHVRSSPPEFLLREKNKLPRSLGRKVKLALHAAKPES